MRTYDVHLPPPSSSLGQPGKPHAAATGLLRLYDAALLKSHVPLAVIGDGNCLFRALSRGLFGVENLHLHIRLVTALEIITHAAHYDTQHPTYHDIISDPTLFHDPYTCQLDSITRPGTYSEFMTLYVASAALSLGLESYCPPAHSTEFRPASMTRKVCGRGVPTDATPAVTLMRSTTRVPRATEPFRPNHLVLLHVRQRALPVAPTSSEQRASSKRRAASRSRPHSKRKIQSRSSHETHVSHIADNMCC